MKGKKSIIFISNEVANGGAGRVISILSNSFIRKGFEVSIYSYQKKHESYPMDSLVKQIFLKVRFKYKVINKLDRMWQLRQIFKKNQNTVIIAFEYFVNMQTLVAGFGLKNRIIISERNDPAQQDNRKIIKYLRSFLYRFADVLICQTPDAKAYFSKAIQNKTIIITNPISEGLPNRIEGPRRKVIVNFGRLERQKNLLLLIDAFDLFHNEYPEYLLSFYGEGREKPHLEDYIKKKNLQNVISINPSLLDIHQKIIDYAMFVSSSDYEGLSNSMIEAMAIGLPCVVTDCPCGGARMVIRSYENGILVPVRDVQAMYEAMKYIVENEEKAFSISQKATKVRLDMASHKILLQWEQVLIDSCALQN